MSSWSYFLKMGSSLPSAVVLLHTKYPLLKERMWRSATRSGNWTSAVLQRKSCTLLATPNLFVSLCQYS